MIFRCSILLLACIAMLAACSATARADIVLTGPVEDSGNGFGTVLNLLTLQNTSSEWGQVLWDGSMNTFSTNGQEDTNSNKTSTYSVSDLAAIGLGINNFSFVFDINEAGNPKQLLLNDFDLVFMDTTGAELFRMTWDSSGGTILPEVGGGVGGSGYRFDVDFTSALEMSFFDTTTNRVGMVVAENMPVDQTSDGPDTFFLVPRENAPVPEPSSMVLCLVGVAMLAGVRRRRA